MAPAAARRRWLPWVVALAVMLGAATWQRLTGPSHPRRVAYAWAGGERQAQLPRSAVTTQDAPVRLEGLDEGTTGALLWRRYPTDDPFQILPLEREEGRLVGRLPRQPAAGKVEYAVVLEGGGQRVRLPADESVVLRFRGPVPAYVLAPHVAVIFLAMLLGVRAALAALTGQEAARGLVRATLALMTVGGMVLGPIVQWHAFGALWTGWPVGQDLTDNKMLVMWLAWVLAALVVRGRGPLGRSRRAFVAAAAVVMLVAYAVPHSARGSQLDWEQVEEGVPPTEAISTG